jgi:hypothetical protein
MGSIIGTVATCDVHMSTSEGKLSDEDTAPMVDRGSSAATKAAVKRRCIHLDNIVAY